jgi:hypothetical protein
MKLYTGRPTHPPTTLKFKGGTQDITSIWGIAVGMTFIGLVRAANTRNHPAPLPPPPLPGEPQPS